MQTATILDLERFSFDAKDGSLVAFESDLRDEAYNGTLSWMQKQTQTGKAFIDIRSHRTQRIERFWLTSVDRDREGDLQAWRFHPMEIPPRTKVLKVVIFND